MDHGGSHSHAHHTHPPAKSVAELRHPPHGSYEGHVVPGVMFILWSAYWIWSIIDIHLKTKAAGLHAYLPLHSSTNHSLGTAATKSNTIISTSSRSNTGRGQPFRSRAWYPWPFWPIRHLEPVCKVVFPLLGVLIELYIGWRGWRPLYKADGHFAEFHANNWQHALMYGGVAVSGAVDLIGYYTPLPAGTEQGFLCLAFLVETLLMGMHAKPNELDQLVHSLLTWIMVSCVVTTAAEIAAPRSLLLALMRAMAVFFQGTWFWHVGSIMFRNHMAWDMDDMAAVMFVPVVFCLHMLLICLGVFSLYLLMHCLYVRFGIIHPSHHTQHKSGDGVTGGERDLNSLQENHLELAEYSNDSGGDIGPVRDSIRKGTTRNLG